MMCKGKWLLAAVLLVEMLGMGHRAEAAKPTGDSLRGLKAAFVRDGHLWVKSGEVEREITSRGKASSPIWSPDGEMVAYRLDRAVWVYKLSEQQYVRVRSSEFQEMEVADMQWAPEQDVLALRVERGLAVVDFRQPQHPVKVRYVAGGVDDFAWLPDGSGWMASANSYVLPSGFSRPALYKIPWRPDDATDPGYGTGKLFFTLPHEVEVNGQQMLAIGASHLKWSRDGKWLAFHVFPTASWSMDSNALCVLSADGKTFRALDEMLLHGNWVQWSYQGAKLGYIAGTGRFVFMSPKDAKVFDAQTGRSQTLTPPQYDERDLTWVQGKTDSVVVARVPEAKEKVKYEPEKQPLPVLYRVELVTKTQTQITNPPAGSGDFAPQYLPFFQHLAWVRYQRSSSSSSQQADVYVAAPDGSGAVRWIEHVSVQYPNALPQGVEDVVSVYDPGEHGQGKR